MAIQVTTAEVEEFVARVLLNLTSREKFLSDDSTIGDVLVKQIKKRVAPGALQNHLSVLGAVRLLVHEVSVLGDRINRYKYIGSYKNFFSSPNAEVGVSFGAHMHDLRPSELYIILERGMETMRFASVVAKQLNLVGEDQAKTFEQAFKKRLEGRLRERHRIVHAHERPSMSSRILELPQPKTAQERQAIGNMLASVVIKMAGLVAQLRGVKIDEAMNALVGGEFREIHEKAFDEEASDMWKLFVDHLNATFV